MWGHPLRTKPDTWTPGAQRALTYHEGPQAPSSLSWVSHELGQGASHPRQGADKGVLVDAPADRRSAAAAVTLSRELQGLVKRPARPVTRNIEPRGFAACDAAPRDVALRARWGQGRLRVDSSPLARRPSVA